MINVTRTRPGPKMGDQYRTPEILAALAEVFLAKCYLCETKRAPGAFDVEHFVSQSQAPILQCRNDQKMANYRGQ